MFIPIDWRLVRSPHLQRSNVDRPKVVILKPRIIFASVHTVKSGPTVYLEEVCNLILSCLYTKF